MIGSAIRSPLVAAPAPGPTPTAPDREPQAGTAAHPFAEMLRQNRLAEAPPAAEPSKASTPAEAHDQPAAPNGEVSAEASASGTSSAQRDAIQSKARSVGASRATAPSTVAPARSAAAAENADDTKNEGAAVATTALANAIVPPSPTGVARPELAQRSDSGAADQVDGPGLNARGANRTTRSLDAAADDAQLSAAISPGANVPGAASTNANELRGATTAATDAATKASDKSSEIGTRGSANPSFAEALAETKAQHSTASSPVAGQSHGAAGAAAALAEPARDVAQGADAAVATSTVPVPVDSPEFAAAFGLQVSTLVRDGVQRAELHLNPTDMGPVSIQITLDGTQARVDFGADLAATRHAIETGLPELASALRDAGFTLAGGGVTQHSRSNGGQTDDANSGSSGSRRSAPEGIAKLDAAAQRVTRRIAAGGVDLYA